MAAAKKATKAKDDQADDIETKGEVLGSFTYVGGGEDSPRRIHFMGKQHFKRGEYTEVTDPEVFNKVKNNPSFIDEEIEPEELEEYDNTAYQAAEEQRLKDKALDAAIKKRYNKLASKGE